MAIISVAAIVFWVPSLKVNEKHLGGSSLFRGHHILNRLKFLWGGGLVVWSGSFSILQRHLESWLRVSQGSNIPIECILSVFFSVLILIEYFYLYYLVCNSDLLSFVTVHKLEVFLKHFCGIGGYSVTTISWKQFLKTHKQSGRGNRRLFEKVFDANLRILPGHTCTTISHNSSL